MNIGGWLLEVTHGSRWCREWGQMVGNWAAAANRQHQPRATPLQTEREGWSNTDLLLLLRSVETVHREAGGQGWSEPSHHILLSTQTHTRSRSSGLGPQRNFRCQILVSSPKITVKRPFINQPQISNQIFEGQHHYSFWCLMTLCGIPRNLRVRLHRTVTAGAKTAKDSGKQQGLEKTCHALGRVSRGVQNTDCQSLLVFHCNTAISCVGDGVECALH